MLNGLTIVQLTVIQKTIYTHDGNAMFENQQIEHDTGKGSVFSKALCRREPRPDSHGCGNLQPHGRCFQKACRSLQRGIQRESAAGVSFLLPDCNTKCSCHKTTNILRGRPVMHFLTREPRATFRTSLILGAGRAAYFSPSHLNLTILSCSKKMKTVIAATSLICPGYHKEVREIGRAHV